MPKTTREEVKRTISEYVVQSSTMETLSHHQRREVFRAVITGLFEFTSPTMLEKTIHCITIHVMAQAIVDMTATSNTDDDDERIIHMSIEPCEGSTYRCEFRVPCWLVSGMKLYYLDVRSHFLPDDGTGMFTRRFEDRAACVVTEVVFVNSGGKKDFRVRSVVDQFKTTVSKMSIYIWKPAEEFTNKGLNIVCGIPSLITKHWHFQFVTHTIGVFIKQPGNPRASI